MTQAESHMQVSDADEAVFRYLNNPKHEQF